MKVEAAIAVMLPQAKKCLGPPGDGREALAELIP